MMLRFRSHTAQTSLNYNQLSIYSVFTCVRRLSDASPPFNKILIANRGEIACRVIKTAKKMGIKTVAIYSDADVHSLHVRMADEAVNVGPPPTSKSYLNVPSILAAIRKTGAEAVHPGYGFLSENSGFVKTLRENGVVFIGPNEKAMFDMGDKIQSKIIAKEAGVHTIPGFNGVITDTDHAVKVANQIDPVMVKASAGGGGKGMRIAWDDVQVKDAYRLSKAEALSSFGDDRLLIEKFIEDPRHIEIQLLGDQFGEVVYLNERECSIQRRNQKVIEEAPSPHIDPETRKRMGMQAVALAKRVGYYSAGTCEFLVDPKKNFYFLEMNTRLQVEHPITELITGIDLVEMMIRVAAKQKLPFNQEQIPIKGWAVESRVYAEDPEKYLPSIGTLSKYIEPTIKSNPSYTDANSQSAIIRCDSGIVEGSEISIHYDPMICKLSTHAATRSEALSLMENALDAYVIKGVTHNIPLLRAVISHPRFKQGKLSTKFLEEEYPKGFKGHTLSELDSKEICAVSAMISSIVDKRNKSWVSGGGSFGSDPINPKREIFVGVSGTTRPVVITETSQETFDVEMDGQVFVCSTQWKQNSPLVASIINGNPVLIQYLATHPLGYTLSFAGTKFNITIKTSTQNELSTFIKAKAVRDMTKIIVSPMPGNIVSVNVSVGAVVAEGAELVVVEAMKMQNVLRASRSGKISKVHVVAGQNVAGDDVLVEFE